VLQVKRIEALGKPSQYRGEKIMGQRSLVLIAAHPRRAHRRMGDPGLRLLDAHDSGRTLRPNARS